MSTFSDALDRLQHYYNDGVYDVVDNPGGLDAGGHRINFLDVLRDVATVAAETRNGGTSSTSLLIANAVTKTFATQPGLGYQTGNYVRASSAANGANFMEGLVSAYSGSSLSIVVSKIGGAGTFADWVFAISGVAGVDFGIPVIPSGRLSYSNTSSLTTADLTGASCATLYYVDCGGGQIPIWDIASSSWKMRTFSGALSLALDSNAAHTLYHAADQVFDVYAYWDAALGSVRLGTSNVAFYNFSNRGTNIADVVQKNGIWVNTLNAYLRINNTGNVAATDYIQPGLNQATYLGSIGTVAAGQGEDSGARRLVFNAYNTKPRHAFTKFTGTAYLYTSATYRQVNANAAMQVEVLFGLNGVFADTEAVHFATCTVFPAIINTAIGLGSTTPVANTEIFGSYGRVADAGAWPAYFRWKGYPGLGRIVFKWLESGTASGTGAGFKPNDDNFRNGISVKAEI
jgi:hypothetical protein